MSFLENQGAHLAFTVASHFETAAQRIDCLHTHTIESDALFERFAVIFTARIENGNGLDELALRNATAIVADGDAQVIFHVDLYSVASIHLKLVDGIVNDFLEEHIDAVLGQVAITQTPDIHTRSGADVLHVGQVPNVVVGIFCCRLRANGDIFCCHRLDIIGIIWRRRG